MRWLTEPGWLTLEVEAPTLCMMATEIGGRCEFRAKPDQPVDGEYLGSGALAFASPPHGLRSTRQRCAKPACAVSHSTRPTRTT